MTVYADIVSYCNFGPSGGTGPTGLNTTGFWAVQQWLGGPTGYTAGAIVRNRTPAVGSERCFIALTGGTGSTGTEPTWVITRGGTVTDGTVLWMEATGLAALNGDLTNTATWAQLKATSTPNVGTLIQRNNGASLQICQAAGTLSGSEPSFSDTAGTRTADGTTVWISLGSPSNYTKWGAPHARLANATTANWSPAGLTGGNASSAGGRGTIFVGDNHAEQQATAITIAPGLTVSDLQKIICADHTVVNPTGGNVRTTASITTTAAASLTFSPNNGGVYCYGLNFQVGPTGSSNNASLVFAPINALYSFDHCNFVLGNNSASSAIQLNTSSAGLHYWNQCSASFGSTGQNFDIGSTTWLWQNSTMLLPGSLSPPGVFGDALNGRMANVLLEGLDMSSYGAQGVIGSSAATWNIRNFTIKDCKLNTAMTAVSSQATGEIYQFVNCEVGATGTSWKSSRYNTEGIETTESSITRVGGAIDAAGNAQSRKIVTAVSQWLRPYRGEAMAVYNSNVNQSVTVTLYGTWNSASVPNNDDIWVEFEYFGTATYPIGTIINTTKSTVLDAATAVSSDNSTWNGGGSGAGWSPFKFSVALNGGTYAKPQFAGLIHVRVRAAKIGSTFYIDPKVILS